MVSFNTSARQMTVSVTQMTQKKMTEMFQRKKQHWRSVTKSYEIKIKQPQSYSRQALSLPWSDEGQIEASAWTYKKQPNFQPSCTPIAFIKHSPHRIWKTTLETWPGVPCTVPPRTRGEVPTRHPLTHRTNTNLERIQHWERKRLWTQSAWHNRSHDATIRCARIARDTNVDLLFQP